MMNYLPAPGEFGTIEYALKRFRKDTCPPDLGGQVRESHDGKRIRVIKQMVCGDGTRMYAHYVTKENSEEESPNSMLVGEIINKYPIIISK